MARSGRDIGVLIERLSGKTSARHKSPVFKKEHEVESPFSHMFGEATEITADEDSGVKRNLPVRTFGEYVPSLKRSTFEDITS